MVDKPNPPPLPAAAQIPAELCSLRRWVGWRYAWAGNKWKKPPYSPLTGEPIGASVEWASHWVDLDTARDGVARLGLDGIGFVFVRSDGFYGIDFDHCRNEKSGKLATAVEGWILQLKTYREVSPSGSGVHIICRGQLDRSRAGKSLPEDPTCTVELYDDGRYFTFTGQHVGTMSLISDCRGPVDRLVAHVFGSSPVDVPDPKEVTIERAVAYLDRVCNELANLRDGRQQRATQVCYWLGRVVGAKSEDPRLTYEVIKDRITTALKKTSWPAEKFEVIERQLRAGAEEPLRVVSNRTLHDEALARVDAWLADEKSSLSYDDAVTNLALLTEEEYETNNRRDRAAKRLGIKKSVSLDKFVAKRRPKVKKDDDELQGSGVSIANVDPWSEPVDGAVLLAELAATFRRFVIFQHSTDPDALALWTISTYCAERFDILPYLGVTAPEKECGKTTAMEVLLYLCWRPLQSSNVTGAAVYRAIELWSPTLLVDELDSFLNDEKNKDLVGIFNAGHKRAFAWVLRCAGEDSEPRQFACFGPKVYGMIGQPPGTMLSRSIIIRLLRKDTRETTEDLNTTENPTLNVTFETLRRKIKRWADDHRDEIAKQQPDTATLANRVRNNWRPLLKIAAVVENGWPERALTAAGVPPPRQKDSDQVRLLKDIRNIFHTRQTDRIPSRVLVRDLERQRESTWYRYHNERNPLDESDLAELLATFEWESKNASLNGGQQKFFSSKRVAKCYVLDTRVQDLFLKFLTGEAENVDVSTEDFGPRTV